jgi:hypothetical protein
MIRKIFLSLLVLLFLVSFTYSAENVPRMPNSGNLIYWVSIGFIVVTIHMLVVVLAYMYSNFFMSEDLKVWSKNEIMQGVYSILILAFFVIIFTFINTLASSYFVDIINASSGEAELKSFCYDSNTNRWSQEGDCNSNSEIKVVAENNNVVCKKGGNTYEDCNPLFLMARSYLGIAFEKLASLHQKLLINYALMNSINSGGINIGVMSSSGAFGINTGLVFMKDGVYINILESLILFVEKLLLALKFQESVLKFLDFGLAFYLIILGLFFRSIFIFRKFGGLLLSLGISFMFVLPLLYVLGWYTLSIPNINIVLNDRFDKGSGSSIMTNWIFITNIISMSSFIAARVLEYFSFEKNPSGLIKTIFDIPIMVGQIVMFVEYDLNVAANDSDFYFTDYTLNNNPDMNTYTVEGLHKMGVFDYISRFLIIALAIPLINIYIFFAFVRGLSPVLGGDAEIPALGRFL